MADLNALLVFATVVESKSFSDAARRLKMPVSTVSRRVSELEDKLRVRLLERSTRSLRLTELGALVFEQARRGAELSEAVDNIVSMQHADVVGTLRLSAPPSISDTLLAPLLQAFQTSYPGVRVQVLITDRAVDHIAEGVDLAFRIGMRRDSALISRPLLRYRHQLVAAPAYLKRSGAPKKPPDLVAHRLLAFSHWKPSFKWSFVHKNGRDKETVRFEPVLAMNDYAGLVPALLSGRGIGELPPLVQSELLASGRLVEVMPDWRFQTFELALLHLGKRNMSKPCRLFSELAAPLVASLFPSLPQ